MVLVLPPAAADRATAFLAGRGIDAWVMGEVAPA
jgi:phosphoribosylaminoimidazole (AIR) synthetase